MPFELAFTAHPALEMVFASVWSMFRAGAVRFRVGGVACLEIRKGRGDHGLAGISRSCAVQRATGIHYYRNGNERLTTLICIIEH